MTTLSLASILAEPARRRPDHVALVEGDQRITFAELWWQARGQAAALVAAGIEPGDRVALMCPNAAEFPRAYFAILAAGAVVVPVHLLLTAGEAEVVLKDSGAKLLLCHVLFAGAGVRAARGAGVRAVGLGPAVSVPGLDDRLEALASSVEPLVNFVARAPEDPAVIFYTSGTTGTPKGAILSHLNLVMNATVNAFDAHDLHPGDVALGALPLFHTFGQTVSMNTIWRHGATLVLLPRFDAAAAIELMVAEGVTVFHGVPTMYLALASAAKDAAALPNLRHGISGGAALPGPVLAAFETAFSTTVYEGYGLSETSPTASVNQLAFGSRLGTVGHAVWGVDVEVADPEVPDRIDLLQPDVLGEIVVRGHNVFTGYLGRPEATAAAVIDGWFRTGDLGTKGSDGFITIVDRVKDMIIRSGFNVYPSEVEEALIAMPGIAQVAVIGLPDDVHGEEVCAVVVAVEGNGAPTAGEVLAYGKEHLAKHKYPRRVEFVGELPLGPSHKVLKRELRKRFGGE